MIDSYTHPPKPAIKKPQDLSWGAAVQKLEDQRLLAEIAQKDAYGKVRLAAIGKLQDQRTLYDIAKNDPSPGVSRGAFDAITDQSLLAEIAQQDESAQRRAAAWAAIRDPDVLAELAQNASDPALKEAAAEKRHQMLLDIVLSEKRRKHLSKALAAVTAMIDPEQLARVVLEVNDSSFVELAVPRIADQALLLDLLDKVKTQVGPYEIITKGRFSDENLILIAKKYPQFWQQAVRRMSLPAIRRYAEQIGERDTPAYSPKDVIPTYAYMSEKAWPAEWNRPEFLLRVGPILHTSEGKYSACPYFDKVLYLIRHMAQNDPAFGPEPCTWVNQYYRTCNVWSLNPRD